MKVDAVVAEVVNHKVEVKTEMSMKVTMKTIPMKTMMKIRETVTWIPVVTKMTGMRMIITIREGVNETGIRAWTIRMTRIIIVKEEEVGVDVWEWITRTTIMMTIISLEIGEVDKEEIKAGAVVTIMITIVLEIPIQEKALAVWIEIWDLVMVEISVMVMEAAINIQEDKVVAMEIVEGALDMKANQTMDITAVLIMDTVVTVDAANLREADMEIAIQIGDLVVLVAEIGELAAMKVVPATVDILKINI
jgi:hypothetical protein